MFKQSFDNLIEDQDMSVIINSQKREPYRNLPTIKTSIFNSLDLDTLFCIFNFCKDEYWRYLASKELKQREWSFHKKYLVWFKRHG